MLTLHIRRLREDTLTFGFFTENPKSGINCVQYNNHLQQNVLTIIESEAQNLTHALRGGDGREIKHLARIATSLLIPDRVIDILSIYKDNHLFIDIDDQLACFPWELMILKTYGYLWQKYYIGRGVRMTPASDVKTFNMASDIVLIADPDGSLPIATKECQAIKKILMPRQKIQLYGKISSSEFFATIEGVGGLHFSGHADSKNLHFVDNKISGDDILKNAHAPFFVFLNSCGAANPMSWLNAETSLVKGFLYGGTRILIAPMEIVGDEAAALFAGAFYHAFASQNKTVGEAFHHARLLPIIKDRVLVPYFLYGNPLFRLPAPLGKGISGKNTVATTPIRQDLPTQQAPRPSTPSEKLPQTQEVALDLSKLRVIIIEPVPSVSSALKEVLTQLRLKNVIQYRSYGEGLRYLLGHKVDLAICNSGVGDEEGLDVLQVIRNSEWQPGLPFVLLGKSMRDEIKFATVWEVECYLLKPIAPQDALKKIKQVLTGMTAPNTYRDLFAQAQNLYRCGKTSDAFTIVSDIIRDYPDRVRPIIFLAEIQNKLGRIDEAIATLKGSIQKNPQFFRAYEVLGNILISQRKLDQALNYFEQEIRHYPKVFQRQNSRRLQIAGLLMDLDRNKDALGHLEVAHQGDRKSIEVLQGLVQVNLRMGDIDESLRYFKKIMLQAPRELDQLIDIAQVASKSGSTTKVVDFIKGLRIDPQNTHDFGLLMSKVYGAMEHHKEALDILKGLSAKTSDPHARAIEGAIYFGKGDFNQALICYEEVIDKLPERHDYLKRYCAILLEMRRYIDVIPLLKKILNHDPSDFEVRRILHATYQAAIEQAKDAGDHKMESLLETMKKSG